MPLSTSSPQSPASNPLSLSEELLLLALNDEKGNISLQASSTIDYGIAGAGLLELIFKKCIYLDAANKLRVSEGAIGESAFQKSILAQLTLSTKHRKLDYWVQRLPSKMKPIKTTILQSLIEGGILSEKKKVVLWVFSLDRYPMVDGSPEAELRKRIHDIVLGNEEPGESEGALLGLVQACGLINEIFEKNDRRIAKKRIKEIAKNQIMAKAVEDALAAAMAAVIAATTAASFAATSAS